MPPPIPHRARRARPGRPLRAAVITSSVCLVAVLGAPRLAAQDAVTEALAEALREAQQTIANLEARVTALETAGGQDPMEAQLQALLGEEEVVPQRTVFPSMGNPRIGVFVDSVIEAGQAEEKLGEDGDRFSLRETEIDIRSAIAPFAEGVLITAFEDIGSGEFETRIEEGYADVALGSFFGTDSVARSKIGRFRLPFGRENRLHTHDLPQVDRSRTILAQLGEEGLIGDGLSYTAPIAYSQDDEGLGSTTTLELALVNGEMFTGEESILGELGEDTGVELDSDAPVIVARASHFTELNPRSDLEVGVSALRGVASDAIETDAGTEIKPRMFGIDATLRLRDDETNVGSWLLSAEAIQTEFSYGREAAPGFPSGRDRTRGFSVTAQRQMNLNTYVGVRVGDTDALGTGDQIQDISPYVSWYASEFFRLRLQGQRIEVDPADSGSTTANRVFLQATWNFGAHQPHPYWSNR